MNSKYRLKFSKTDRMRFIGHLDLMTLFRRSIKKAVLPIAYSQGFNPHQLMSFALPLSLGVSSVGEYLDIELEVETDENIIKDKLNKVLPLGVSILDVKSIEFSKKTAASLLVGALYSVKLDKVNDLDKAISELLSQKEIIVEKKTKKGLAMADIRNDIYDVKKIDEYTIELFIATGSQGNLKPEVVVSYIYKLMDVVYDKYKVKYERIDLYESINGEFVRLGDWM